MELVLRLGIRNRCPSRAKKADPATLEKDCLMIAIIYQTIAGYIITIMYHNIPEYTITYHSIPEHTII